MARQRRLWRKEMEGRGIGPELLEQMDVLGPEANMTVVDGYTGPGQDRGLEAAKRQIQEAVESGELTEVGGQILREAVATDPEEWSDELKTKLLTLKPDQTIEQIAESFRDVRGGSMIYGYSVRTKSRYERESLFLLVDQDGNMKLNHKPVTFATLGGALANCCSGIQARMCIFSNDLLSVAASPAAPSPAWRKKGSDDGDSLSGAFSAAPPVGALSSPSP